MPVVDLTLESGGSNPDLGYLLEVSDDELGLPSSENFSDEAEKTSWYEFRPTCPMVQRSCSELQLHHPSTYQFNSEAFESCCCPNLNDVELFLCRRGDLTEISIVFAAGVWWYGPRVEALWVAATGLWSAVKCYCYCGIWLASWRSKTSICEG
ncbi:hypothetical protein ACFX11_032848 [Malus domestica]